MAVNRNGSFFKKNDNQGQPFIVGADHYAGASLFGRVETLLHELAHMLHSPDFQNNFGAPPNGRWNDELLRAQCKALI